MKRVILWLLLAVPVLPVVAVLPGCSSDPTPAAPLSPEEEKKLEDELKRERNKEGKAGHTAK